MIRIELQVELSYEVDDCGADFVFNIHAAHTQSQIIRAENLMLSQSIVPHMHTDRVTGNRYMRLRASPGVLRVSYCQSDRLVTLAINEFGNLRQGHSRVQTIRDWVNSRVAFAPNSSNSLGRRGRPARHRAALPLPRSPFD